MKKVFVDYIKKDFDVTKKDAKSVFDCIIQAIVNELKTKHRVRVEGLGVFLIKETKNRKVMHNISGKKYVFPAYKRIKFKPANPLKKWLKNI